MKKKILITLGVILLLSGYLFIESKYLKPSYINVRKETIKDDSIPDSFNNFEIVFFSDLTYDEEIDLEMISKRINNLNPDIVIFGGDVSSESSYLYNQDIVNEITEFFKSIKANYAKYAVLGEKDTKTEFLETTINDIFINSGFEVLNNKAIRFRINTSDYINIVGLEDYISGKFSPSSAFSNVKPDTYTLVVSHSPDIFTELTGTGTKLCLAGHSLGGIANIPIWGPIHRADGFMRYYKGIHTLSGMKLDITDGIYVGKDNLRFFTNNEIVSYKIKKDIVKVEEPIEETKPVDFSNKEETTNVSENVETTPEVVTPTDNIETKPVESIPEETPNRTPAIENVFGD